MTTGDQDCVSERWATVVDDGGLDVVVVMIIAYGCYRCWWYWWQWVVVKSCGQCYFLQDDDEKGKEKED